jgi:hypothetical protein
VEFYIRAVDTLEHVSVSPPDAPIGFYRLFVVQGFFADDFESDRGWIPSQPGDAQNGRWLRWDPIGTWWQGIPIEPADDHTPAGTLCYETGGGAVGGDPFDSDVDGGCVTLTSPRIDLSDAQQAFVSYWRWFALEVSQSGYFVATVSSDNGTSWAPLETLLSSENSWTCAAFDLNSKVALTSAMRFRFVACDLGAESLCEAAIDDFLVGGIFLAGNGPAAGVPPATSLRGNLPNPFAGRTDLRFALSRSGPVRLNIYDAGGRCVRRLTAGPLPAGEHKLTWDGRGDAGEPLGSGVYFYELQAGGIRDQRKMLRIK